jgi:outer membrane protein TolC
MKMKIVISYISNKFFGALSLLLMLFAVNCIFQAKLFSQGLLKLEDAISIGLKNNYDIQISKSEAQISKENNTAGNAGMLPDIDINARGNYSASNSNQTTSNYNAGIALNWTVFDGFRMFTSKHKLEEIERVGEIKYKSQIQQSIAEIIDAYYEIVKQKQVFNTIREIKALSFERMTIGETRFNAGLSAKTELLQAQIDYNTQSQNEIQQENVIAEAKRKLNRIINREVYESYEVIDSISYSQIDSALAETRILEANPTIRLLKQELEVSRLSTKEIQSKNLPYINLSAGYGLLSSQSSSGSSVLNNNNSANLGLNLTYPLYQGGNISRQIQVSEITAYTAELELSAAKNRIKTQFLNSLNVFRTNLRLLEIESSTKILAKENLYLAMERLKLGQTTAIEVRDAQVSYENSLTRLSNIYFNLKLSETDLKLLMGEL